MESIRVRRYLDRFLLSMDIPGRFGRKSCPSRVVRYDVFVGEGP